MLWYWALLLNIGVHNHAAAEINAAVFQEEGAVYIKRATVVFPMKIAPPENLKEKLYAAIEQLFVVVRRRTALIDDERLTDMTEQIMKTITASLHRIDPFITA